ncbi:hypothetical protein FRC05_007717, partial [Tulasnella sp. 425]
NAQALRQSEADRIWDAEEARALAKEEEEENAKRRPQQSDLQVKSDFTSSSRDRLLVAGFRAQARRRRDSSNGPHRVYRRADLNHTSGDCVPVDVGERWNTIPPERGIPLIRGSSPVEEYRDEDDDSYEGPFLESPATCQGYLSSRAWRPPATLPK